MPRKPINGTVDRKVIVSSHRSLKMNLGQYESVEVSESLEMECPFIDYEETKKYVREEVDKRLLEAAAAEVIDRDLPTKGSAPAGPVALSMKEYAETMKELK